MRHVAHDEKGKEQPRRAPRPTLCEGLGGRSDPAAMPRGRGISESRDSLTMSQEQMDAALGDCLPGSDDSSSGSDDEGFDLGNGVANPLQRTPLDRGGGREALEMERAGAPNRFLACIRRCQCGCLSRIVSRSRHEGRAPLELEDDEEEIADQLEL